MPAARPFTSFEKDSTQHASHWSSCVKCRKTFCNARHNKVSQTTARLANQSGVQAFYELPPDGGGSRKRPDGKQLGLHGQGRDNLSDTVISHPTSPSYIKAASRKRGAIAKRATQRKNNQWKDIAKAQGASFTALSLETYGLFDAPFLKFHKKLAQSAVNCGLADPRKLESSQPRDLCSPPTRQLQSHGWVDQTGKGVRPQTPNSPTLLPP
jgi:hypothetical protein